MAAAPSRDGPRPLRWSARGRRWPPAMMPCTSVRRHAEGRRALGGVEHAEPAAGAGADVEQPAAARNRSTIMSTAAAIDFRWWSRPGDAKILGVDQVHDGLCGQGVDVRASRVAFLCRREVPGFLHGAGTIFPRMTGSVAPVAVGTLLAVPRIVAHARIAKATASRASTRMPNSICCSNPGGRQLLLQQAHQRPVVGAAAARIISSGILGRNRR